MILDWVMNCLVSQFLLVDYGKITNFGLVMIKASRTGLFLLTSKI